MNWPSFVGTMPTDWATRELRLCHIGGKVIPTSDSSGALWKSGSIKISRRDETHRHRKSTSGLVRSQSHRDRRT